MLTLDQNVIDYWLTYMDENNNLVAQDVITTAMIKSGLTRNEVSYIVDQWLQEA